MQQLHKQGVAKKKKIKEYTFPILTTAIAQGYSQIHGIITSICFNSWISTTFYVKYEKKVRFVTMLTDSTSVLIIQFGQAAYQEEFLHISHDSHALHIAEVFLHSAKAEKSLRHLATKHSATVIP